MIASFLRRILTQEGSTRPLALLRIALAVIALAKFAFHMLPSHGQHPARLLLGLSFYLSCLLMLIGLHSRVAAGWAGATQIAMHDGLGRFLELPGFVSHHAYLLAVCTLVVALGPCGRSYSVDRWRQLDDPAGPPAERGATWPLTLLAVQLSAVYFWAAYDKLDGLFLSGTRIEHMVAYFHAGSDPVTFSGYHGITRALAFATVGIELFLAFGLWVRRWHRVAIPLGLAFHAILYVALQIDTFTVTVWALYLAYVDPDRVHAVIDRLQAPSR